MTTSTVVERDRDARSLGDVLLRGAARDPGRRAYACGEEALSVGTLTERALSLGAGLRRRGVEPGDRVVLVMPAGLRLIEVFWAAQLAGAVTCILNPDVPSAAIARRAAVLRPRLTVTEALAGELAERGRSIEPVAAGVDDLAYLQMTSGTSGEPRAAMISHGNVLALLQANDAAWGRGSNDVFVGWLPPWHDFGLVRFVIEPVFRGVACHLLEPSIRGIRQWLPTISVVGGTVTGGPDLGYRLAMRAVDPGAVDLASLRIAFNGAEPVRASTIERFEDRFGTPGVVRPGYGLAEATLGVAFHRPGEVWVRDGRGAVSCGRPLDGLEVRAGDRVDRPGEILVRGPSVFAGYFDAPRETAAVLRDGWLHTGDSGYLDATGRLFVLGRRAGMLKRGGAVVAPRELEEAAESVPEVRLAAATSVPSSGDGEPVILVAVETADTDAHGGSAEEIRAEVSRRIVDAVGFAPGRICVVAPRTIPRTHNGKIRHGLLAAALGEQV